MKKGHASGDAGSAELLVTFFEAKVTEAQNATAPPLEPIPAVLEQAVDGAEVAWILKINGTQEHGK